MIQKASEGWREKSRRKRSEIYRGRTTAFDFDLLQRAALGQLVQSQPTLRLAGGPVERKIGQKIAANYGGSDGEAVGRGTES